MKINPTSTRYFTAFAAILVAATLSFPRLVHCTMLEGGGEKTRAAIAIERTSHDFGDVLQGDTVRTSFPIGNASDDTVTIYDLEPNPESVRASLSRRSIPPGESGTLDVSLKTSDLMGALNGEISVITSVPDQREIIFRVTANVQPALALQPPLVFAGRVAKTDSFPGRARLVGKIVDEGTLSRLSLVTSSKSLRGRIVPWETEGRKSTCVEFILSPSARAGTFEESITVISEDPPARAILKIVGEKLGDIEVHPSRFEFFAPEGIVAATQSISITSPKFMRITRIEDVSGLLDISLEMLEDGRTYRIDAKLKEPPRGSFLGLVKVFTDLEEQPLIDIPVIGGFAGLSTGASLPGS